MVRTVARWFAHFAALLHRKRDLHPQLEFELGQPEGGCTTAVEVDTLRRQSAGGRRVAIHAPRTGRDNAQTVSTRASL